MKRILAWPRERCAVVLAEIVAIERLKPIMFASMAFAIGYGVATNIISTVELSFVIGFTGSYSLILGCRKYYALSEYKRTLESGDAAFTRKIEMRCAKNITITTEMVAILALPLPPI